MSRVAQLDSYLLDDELNNILAGPVSNTPEFRLALKFTLLYLGLKSGASYGAKLQNLRYHLSRRNRWTFLLLATLPGYLYATFRDRMLVQGWPDYPRSRRLSKEPARQRRELKRLAWDLLALLENVLTAAKLLNFLLFLYDGRHPTLLTRLLKLRFAYARKSVARNVSFDFLNRQLVWEAFTEFLLFIMPLIDLQAIRGWFSTKKQKQISSATAALSHLPAHVCAICHTSAPMPAEPVDPIDPMTSTAFLASLSTEAGQEATVPYVTDCCGGRYCFYCITSALYTWEKSRDSEDKELGWACLRCGKPVLGVTRWDGTAANEPESLSTGKVPERAK